MKQVTKNDLRCECRRKPLLAIFGLDDRGKVYLHVKVYKGRRVFGEILVTQGEVELRCRECLRWYKVIVPARGKPELVETPEPQSPETQAPAGHV